jgi:hypothetical protein
MGRPPGSKNKSREDNMANISKHNPLPDPEDDPDFKAATPKATPLTIEMEPEPAPLFDEVASGEVIPEENALALIGDTLGGSGDNHASARLVLQRFEEAGWEIRKALDAGSGDTRKRKGKKGK